MEFNPTQASKAQISNMKKPQGLPEFNDNYQRPELEKYEKPEFEKSQKEKTQPEIKTPEIKIPEEPYLTNDEKKSSLIKIPNEKVVNETKVRFW